MLLESPVPEVEAPRDCPLCPRLVALREELRTVHPDWWNAPVRAFGDRDAWLGIVGLAPGMFGANRTGRPFTGDYAGLLLYETLHKYRLAKGVYAERIDDSLRLTGCVILNSVKCLPPGNKPLPAEVATCRRYYEAALAALRNVRVLVALGQIAHGSAVRTAGGRLSAYKFGHLAEHRLPDGRLLIDSYHCSRYNQNTGRLTAAMFESVFARALELRPLTVAVSRVEFSNISFEPLLCEAEAEDGAFLLRLRDEWLSGKTRFDREGEILYGAFLDGNLVAVGGISRDPYDPAEGLGRVRHLYVLRQHRTRGIGRTVLEHLLDHARGRFTTLRLTTRRAGHLYESFGFVRCDAPHQTHRLAL